MRLSAGPLTRDPSRVCAALFESRALVQLGEPGPWPVVGCTCVSASPGPRAGPHWGLKLAGAGSGLKTKEGPGLSPPARGFQERPVCPASLGQTRSVWRGAVCCFRLAFLLDLRLKYFSWWQKWLSALSPSRDGRNVQEKSSVLAPLLNERPYLPWGLERQCHRSALPATGDREALGWESGCPVSVKPPPRAVWLWDRLQEAAPQCPWVPWPTTAGPGLPVLTRTCCAGGQ